MEKKIVVLAAVFGLTAIILGAFGAHALKKVLSPDSLTSFETGVKYQFYHALFLLFISQTTFLSLKEKEIIFWLTLSGVIFFSCSIYLLTTQSITNLKLKFLGPITPIGGFLLIGAWAYFLTKTISKNIG